MPALLTCTVYAEYAKTSNLVAVAIYGLLLIGAQTAQIGKSHRCNSSQKTGTHTPFGNGGEGELDLPVSPDRRNANMFDAGGSVWLKNWAEVNSRYGGNPDTGKYISIYFAFGIGSAALVVVQTLILWIFCSIEVCNSYSLPSYSHVDMAAGIT